MKFTLSPVGRMMMLFCRSAAPGEQLWDGVFKLCKGLAGSEAALLAVDAGMGQIEMGGSYAGERPLLY